MRLQRPLSGLLRDQRRAHSLAARFRRRRFLRFLDLIEGFEKPVEVLDVGGTLAFWKNAEVTLGQDVHVTLLNHNVEASEGVGYRQIAGDARDLSRWSDREFPVVFSNSVIEHVGGPFDQRRMADEVRRVGRAYYVQTPNYWFPVEPHFLFPLFQFLPVSIRTALVRALPLAWAGRVRDPEQARHAIENVQLLTKGEMRVLFPDSEVVAESFLGVAKSYTAIRTVTQGKADSNPRRNPTHIRSGPRGAFGPEAGRSSPLQ